MARGKNINLYLMDGDVNGRVKCTMANWTGIAFKIPRTDLEKCKDREELKQSGVYFLFGTSDQTGKPVVYVGQAGARKNGEGILNRLQEHKRNPERDYWTEAVVFTTTDHSFGPTEISYLENRFCNLAIEAGRYEVKNGNEPSPGQTTEEKESELEEYIDYAKIMMGTLGHKVFMPKDLSEPSEEATAPSSSEPTDWEFTLTRSIRKDNITVEARARQTAEGFVVLSGSIIAPHADDTISPGVRERRKEANIDENHTLLTDELFSSPSSAAMFVIGKSANGLTSWKAQDGRTLADLESTE